MNAIKKDWINFFLVMLAFTGGMVVLVANHVYSWWVWAIYIGVWTLSEMAIAKNLRIPNWLWVVILLVLFGIDAIVLSLFN